MQLRNEESLLRAVFSVQALLGALALMTFYMTVTPVDKVALHAENIDSNNNDASEILRKAESYKPSKLAAKGKFTDAVLAAQSLLDEKPHEPAAYLCAGNVMLKANLKEDALNYLKTATGMAPKNRFVRLAYARALSTSGHVAEAVSQYRQLSTQAPRWYDSRMELAQLLLLNNQPAEAVTELQEIIKLFPEKAVAHKLCGVALARAGRAEEGMDEYMAGVAAEVRTGRPEALGNILSSFGSMDKAKYYLEQRVAEQQDPMLKLRLGQVYMYLNDFPQAKKTLLDARKAAPTNSEIRRSLCVLYVKMGDRRPALSEFIQSVALEREAEQKRPDKS